MKEKCYRKNIVKPCPRKVLIFQSLSDEEILKIASMTKHKQFKKGQPLIHEGEKSDTLFIINQGQVKLSKLTLQGKEQILHILTSGECFCELNIFNCDEKSNFSAYAIEDTKICMLTKVDMDSIMERNPGIALKLLKTVTQRLAHTENLAHNLATNNPEVRIAYIILEFCETYGKDTDKGILINLPLTREEMANYIGMTRETISRKLSKFEELGFMTSIGNKQIIVENKLAFREYIE
ncbi:Crp/Fnr family transcriptional regulator [Bacillus pseudomycoides]|uniref:cAMP-binding protein n=1 Tax=Bacillus pseudomycoides TaxID=64104 RepID=A0A2C3PQ09_9BACI|nr:Crp/Fnr family transcriptional regulator [Bacillus pseudomycoides]PDY44485.1 cAMP-binding protein [Bacillus pseudomycoides]PEA83544.1 cAMP-binding protein [Bacillus pseudomycoides]PED07936.1 cAMP-binding protein [Bacillus pseudomycoides]PED72422.1 cAMP-binding protein [Bacillus pseudomycoides]PEI42295.1 cAMP-binding protein [Bacillus pseudomycoides]